MGRSTYDVVVSAPRRLTAFPRNRLIPHELVRGRIRELDLLVSVGPPTAVSDPLSIDPRFFWDLEWPCGLVVSVELHQVDEDAIVFLDRPEVDHALRHLGVEVFDRWDWSEEDPGAYRLAVPSTPSHSWSVWAEHEDGEDVRVASGLTGRDAACMVRELEQARAAALLSDDVDIDLRAAVHFRAERSRDFSGGPLPIRSSTNSG